MARSMTKAEEIQILVCSANLGNACPDQGSWSLWVPEDGQCNEVISDNPKYPLSMSGVETDPPVVSEDENQQFALIVFGLQESTFETEKSPTTAALSSSGTSSVRSDRSGIESLSQKKSSTIAVMNRTKQKIESLTANRDHTSAVKSDSGSRVLHDMMAERLPSYDRVVSFQRGEMRLEIMAHLSLISVELVHVAAQNTGRHGLANKGGIVAELIINETTRVSFVTTHLEAHEGRYATRVSTMNDIFAGTKEKLFDCSLTAHHSFVMGDLNFRSEHPNRETMGEEKHKELIRGLVERKDWKALYELDELSRALQRKHCLTGYRTPDCHFPPTFKVERGPGFAYVDQRLPSYTDRVLWRSNHNVDSNLQPLVYEPIEQFLSSDHKPIRAAFRLQLNHRFQLTKRLQKPRSIINLNRSDELGASLCERCHLFVNDISFKIHHRDDKNNWTPNPYLCLMTDPPKCLQAPQTKGIQLIMSNISKALGSLGSTKSTHTNRLGFPRSSIQHQTFEGAMDGEISVQVATHDAKNGSPINLSRALLFLALMDHKPSMPDDTVVGTVVVNLAKMMQECRPMVDNSKTSSLTTQQGLRGFFGRLRQQSAAVFGNSVLDIDDSTTDFLPIESLQIDQPLLKNGVEKGTLRCTVELWWMDDSLGTSSFLVNSERRR